LRRREARGRVQEGRGAQTAPREVAHQAPERRLTVVRMQVFRFFGELAGSRRVVFELMRRDLSSRYLGSGLGLFWMVAQPAATILVLWFVFSFGFGARSVGRVPFILWLVAGIVPWFFLAESVSGATNAVIDHGFLVKKIPFRVHLLPLVRILSALAVHLVFVGLSLVLLWLSGFPPGLHALQLPYYLLATVAFVLGLSWCTSALIVFLRDLGPVVALLLQFGFWLTPVFWDLEAIPPSYAKFVMLNPAYYLVQGYRESLLQRVWFWRHAELTLYFWAATLVLLAAGAWIFRRLRPHFADVL